MTSEIYDKSREELIRRELEELKLCLRMSEAEREELAKNFLNQCDRIEVLEATAEDLNERPAHQQGFSEAALDRLRTAFKQKDKIAKKLLWSVRESEELFKRNERLQLSIVNGKILERSPSTIQISPEEHAEKDVIPSILQDNVRELAEHSGYVPSPPLKPVQSILKSCYIPSLFLARKPSLVHMHQLATPLKNLQCLLSPPKSKAKANVRKATSFFIPLNDEKSQSLLKIHSKPSLIPAFRRQLPEKYNVPLQRKASRIPVLQARSNTQILPLIKATQSTITKHHEKMTSGSRKVSLRLPSKVSFSILIG